MNNLLRKEKNNKFDTIKNFLNPDRVYIPIYEGFKLEVKTNSIIKKEQILMSKEDKYIYSPVSGKVLGKSSDILVNGKQVEAIVIENDFKETVQKQKGCLRYINEYDRNTALNLIKQYNATQVNLDVNVNNLVVNGCDIDPFEYTSSLIINENSDKILETIDALGIILGIKNVVLAINNNDSKNVINLTNNIGTYPNINLKLLPDIYPNSFKCLLINQVLSKKEVKAGYLYLTVEDILNIYNVLKKKKPIIEKYVTVAGNCIDNEAIVNVKIGTTFKDVINSVCNITDNKYNVIINGLINGNVVSNLNEVVDYKTRSIFLSCKLEDVEKKCINCGLCNLKCPVGLNPKYIKEHKKADRSKCIKCGLCTFNCPSKINFKPYLGGYHEE